MVSVRRRGGPPAPGSSGGGSSGGTGSFSARTNYRLKEIPPFPGGSHSSTTHHNSSTSSSWSSSWCVRVIRYALLAFIVFQLVSLGIKVARSPRGAKVGLGGTMVLSGSLGLLRGPSHPDADKVLDIVKGDAGGTGASSGANQRDDVTDAQHPDEKEEDDDHDAGAHHDGADGVGGVEPEEPLTNVGGDTSNDEEEDEEPKPIEPPPSGEEEEEDPAKKEDGETEVARDGEVVLATGANDQAFVVDLVHQRTNPDFRNDLRSVLSTRVGRTSAAAASKIQAAAQLAGLASSAIHPCEYVQLATSRVLQRANCRDGASKQKQPQQQLYYYNPAPFSRYWCDHEILPGGALLVPPDSMCQQPVRVFQVQPQLLSLTPTPADMPPVVIKAHDNLDPSPELEKVVCDVPCQVQSHLPERGDRTIEGTDWKIAVNDADPFLDERAKVELTAFKSREYYSTMSHKSSVPLSLYSFDLYDLRNRPALDWETADNAATYLLDTHCNTAGLRRQKWYAAMAANFPTRSYGQCEHNTDLQLGETTQTLEGRIALSKKNRIHLAFEASGEKDYVTSVVWESLLSGAVPAILGARNLHEILPPHSAILASGFNSWDAFANYVKTVSENRTLWESYHAWRSNETAIRQFEARFHFTRTHPSCRTCRWAYAKLYGLGWNHQQQAIEDSAISRQLCVDETHQQLVVQPFREEWHDMVTTLPSSAPCLGALEGVKTTIEAAAYKITRSVEQRDGVIDMTVHSVEASASTSSDLVVRFHFRNVQNADGSCFPHFHTLVPTTRGALVSSAAIQDDRAKVSVLASWPTEVRSPSPGVLEVVVLKKGQRLHPDESLRIRVITEDRSEIHDKRTEYFPSTFARQMTIDFVDAMELYYTEA